MRRLSQRQAEQSQRGTFNSPQLDPNGLEQVAEVLLANDALLLPD